MEDDDKQISNKLLEDFLADDDEEATPLEDIDDEDIPEEETDEWA
jgi:hypothetical protein